LNSAARRIELGSAAMQTSNGLPPILTADVTCCGYYYGTIMQGHFVLNCRPSQYYELQAV
jgi:hypothetical protein